MQVIEYFLFVALTLPNYKNYGTIIKQLFYIFTTKEVSDEAIFSVFSDKGFGGRGALVLPQVNAGSRDQGKEEHSFRPAGDFLFKSPVCAGPAIYPDAGILAADHPSSGNSALALGGRGSNEAV